MDITAASGAVGPGSIPGGRKDFLLCLTAALVLCGCSTTPRSDRTIDSAYRDCKKKGYNEEECQRSLGCEPGQSKRECRKALRNVYRIWLLE